MIQVSLSGRLKAVADRIAQQRTDPWSECRCSLERMLYSLHGALHDRTTDPIQSSERLRDLAVALILPREDSAHLELHPQDIAVLEAALDALESRYPARGEE